MNGMWVLIVCVYTSRRKVHGIVITAVLSLGLLFFFFLFTPTILMVGYLHMKWRCKTQLVYSFLSLFSYYPFLVLRAFSVNCEGKLLL